MSWIDKILPAGIGQSVGERANVPEGLWHKCVKCEAVLYRPDLENNENVCPKCDHKFPPLKDHQLMMSRP